MIAALRLRQAEEELSSERITGEIGLSPRPVGGGDDSKSGSGGKPKPKPKPRPGKAK